MHPWRLDPGRSCFFSLTHQPARLLCPPCAAVVRLLLGAGGSPLEEAPDPSGMHAPSPIYMAANQGCARELEAVLEHCPHLETQEVLSQFPDAPRPGTVFTRPLVRASGREGVQGCSR